ncbi:hypothetical protein IAQ61_008113 [Plenodomus lingam]|uniref:Similar to glycosyl hydrolase family 85 protein n=1 Tax=Leptosphaeria maculans (strain JN3 / isolate v23.1.3 / race Av1-4-5-6-7-8) TaxID=985895 RepID=E5A080_LEPMJ|nr:similar to glycosyl hydrolase family 85 protein [Plenodomus lingam JN3]KAH9867519.1 hypothetical protein IAQ61_008113 [Plenodomus lingam]CBX96940.1 similar to glycosyl hydrolase family 85 protein [Plenodomus lingam JN3]
MAYLFGWKDILRPIRDGYRHLFPVPDTGPTPEERRKQRELDRLKGFTYFDSFEQLDTWTENESDPLQRANTPLLSRRQVPRTDDERANVLLIHDYSGNYHDYESIQSSALAKELYTCEYLQYVDKFIYFSHKLVCVPPPTWTNALHRNGVKVLGTVLAEPQTKDTERLLEHVTSANDIIFPMVKKLVAIAEHHGFDGYLINIEKPFSGDVWDPKLLQSFLGQLKSGLGESKQLIWYDALTISNKISYQNALNTANMTFAKACGSILTNYCWSEADAKSSQQLAFRNDMLLVNIFFGLDVWAQNATTLSHPRVTYPGRGGGGTNTGVAVAKLASLGLSAGIFAPAWSFEHFASHGREMERTVWEGEKLPPDIECACGDCAVRHQANEQHAVVKHAREFPAGSESFFYTDFNRAFSKLGEKETEVFGGRTIHTHLSQQSILPCSGCVSNETITLTHFLNETAVETALVIKAATISLPANTRIKQSDPWLYLPLYKLSMPLTRKLILRSAVRKPAFPSGMEIELYIRTTRQCQGVPITRTRLGLHVNAILGGEAMTAEDTVTELGVRARGIATTKGPAHVLWISSICITPDEVRDTLPKCNITNVHIISRGGEENPQLRLKWTCEGADSLMAEKGMPYSDITGVFAYFEIEVDGLGLGRAYALEHIVNAEVIAIAGERDVAVKIAGIGFDGRRLAESSGDLSLQPRGEDSEWVEDESGVK